MNSGQEKVPLLVAMPDRRLFHHLFRQFIILKFKKKNTIGTDQKQKKNTQFVIQRPRLLFVSGPFGSGYRLMETIPHCLQNGPADDPAAALEREHGPVFLFFKTNLSSWRRQSTPPLPDFEGLPPYLQVQFHQT